MINKKLLCVILVMLLVASLLSPPAFAEELEPTGVNASDYFISYSVSLQPGTSAGNLKFAFSVTATHTMVRLGIDKIVVWNANGTKYLTRWGTTGNGLIKANSVFHSGTNTISAVSGNSYYCVATVYAKDSAGHESHGVYTATVTCP